MSFKFYLTLIIIAIFLTFQANNIKADASNSIKHDTTISQDSIDKDSTTTIIEPKVDLSAIQQNIIYPEMAKKAGVEGLVVVRVLIGKDGVPIKYLIDSSESTMLNDAAANAVMKSKFVPATENKKPIKCWIAIPVSFKLK